MNIYLQDEIVFGNYEEACKFVVQLPAFSLAQINAVSIAKNTQVYQVMVYCFDDEVDVSNYE